MVITPPRFGIAEFHVTGTAPLVVHRFSVKTKEQLLGNMEAGSTARGKRVRLPLDAEKKYNEGRYFSKDGWDGFHAGSLRNAMISACKLVGFQMTRAKLSIFTRADGWDALEPQIPLVRIIGKPTRLDMMARTETKVAYITIRPAYYDWKAVLGIRWDQDQFTLQDITNLVMRVGMQVGLCEGRPDSANSNGLGWGLFEIGKTKKL